MAKVNSEVVEFNQVRGMVRKEIIERYGGISKFLQSKKGEELGGMKMKIYLYDTGLVNFEFISALCKFFGIGDLSRKIVVSRRFLYSLHINPNSD